MSLLKSLAFLVTLAGCATPAGEECAAQLSPDMRGYVCRAGMNDWPDDQDKCPLLACEAIVRDDPNAYVSLARNASTADGMTFAILQDADDTAFERLLRTLQAADAVDRRQPLFGFASAAKGHDKHAEWAPALADLVRSDKKQAAPVLETALLRLSDLDLRTGLITALAIAFDPQFDADARDRAAVHLAIASKRSGFPLTGKDYEAARAEFEAATTPEQRAVMPPNSPLATSQEQGVALRDRGLMTMATALATAP